MKKLLLIAAVLYAASFAFSFEQVLWESDFENFTEGEIIGQVDAYGNQVTVMNNGDRCTGVAPDAGDYTITTFDESKVLKVKRTGGSGGDKGINIRLNWGVQFLPQWENLPTRSVQHLFTFSSIYSAQL